MLGGVPKICDTDSDARSFAAVHPFLESVPKIIKIRPCLSQLQLVNVGAFLSHAVCMRALIYTGASIPQHLGASPPSPSPFLFLPFPLEVGPLIAARGLGSALAPSAGPGGARPPNGIW